MFIALVSLQGLLCRAVPLASFFGSWLPGTFQLLCLPLSLLQVFDKRPHPAEISSVNEDRAFVTMLNMRGRRALAQARSQRAC